ncbi:uncharacterized protein LOC110888140 [Helianthus annuus]|uniref:uncharacterized protein LOC110888140 n=1 Tax=Helianthus annuus TaxID=4232 RepID=UPI000B8F44F8|nr:uncharacterized protein LOC110888140 [Helianthus annuus]
MNLEALWAKVIKAIHENKRRKKHIPIDNRTTGIWKDIVAAYKELDREGIKLEEKLAVKLGNGTKAKFWLDNWAGGMPFADKYPDLFKIVKNKNASVAELAIRLDNETQWNIEWSRPPNNDGEWAQWTDKWEEFSVAIIKDQFIKRTVSEQEERWQHWNTWVPAKVNYFTWRTAIGRVPVKSELRKRGIMLNNDICSGCGSADESVNHLISECTSLKTVWWNILAWMKLPTSADVNSTEKIISQGWKKTVKLVFQAIIWNLWKARNEREFKGIARSGNNIVEDIKADTFLWLKCKSKFKDIVWERWMDFNIRDIVT